MSLRLNWVFAAVALSACGGAEKEVTTGPGPSSCPPGQYFDGMYCQMQPQQGYPQTGQPQQGYPQTGQPQTGQPQTGQPQTTQPPAGTAVPPTTTPPVDPNAAATLLNLLARQHTPPGAQPVGGAIAGQFATGQSMAGQINMQPGKCYTVVAAGAPPVQEVDVQIQATIALPGMASPALAVDKTTGPTGVIGSKSECYRWAFPFPAAVKVVLTVTAGSGMAAAQVFEANVPR